MLYKRILADILFIVSLNIFPIYLSGILGIVYLFLFPWYIEFPIAFLFLDLTFGRSDHPLLHTYFFYTILSLICVAVVYTLKHKLRTQ